MAHELVHIHPFEKQKFAFAFPVAWDTFCVAIIKLSEFRCNVDVKHKCVHLKTRQEEFEIYNKRILHQNKYPRHYFTGHTGLHQNGITSVAGRAAENTKTIELTNRGIICRHVLEVMVDEYGEDAVDDVLDFHCFLTNSIFEQPNGRVWERVIYETLGVDKKLPMRDNISTSRQRISCMQVLCSQKRMNDIHRFCLPKRFFTLLWFKWACNALKKIFSTKKTSNIIRCHVFILNIKKIHFNV